MATRRSVALVALVVLAGCAGLGLPDAAPQASPTPSPTATPSPTPTGQNGTLSVHFVNVGQGESTLIVGPTGETMLIDSGPFTDQGATVLRYLKRHDVERIDHLVTTHADADHIGGHAAIIEYYETQADGIGAVYDPGIAASTRTYEAYLRAIERHNVTLYETRAGDTISFDGARVRVLAPPEPYLAARERNENSLVLELSVGRVEFLFTGDAGVTEEAYLVERYGAMLDATVLKAGHHGSASSTSAAFLAAVSPAVVVISSAYDSQYGHPDEAVLNRLTGTPTLWTGVHGTIVMATDGRGVYVRTQRAAPVAPARLRAAAPIDPDVSGPVRELLRIEANGTVSWRARTPALPDGGTTGEGAAAGLSVVRIHADAAGDDRANLNDEYVVFTNAGNEPLSLGGYTVSDAAGATYTFASDVTLVPGATLTLHTGSGTDTATDIYWGAATPIWNNDGDTVIVTDERGRVVLEVRT